jgi:hypothetical protein
MSKVWPWVGGIVVGLCIIGLLVYGRSDRRAYWAARTVTVFHADVTPRPIDRLMERSPGR